MNSLFPTSGAVIPTLEAPPGTRCLFHQASPPLGWVTDTTITDHALRVVTGAGGGTGGTTNSSTWIGAGTFAANAFTISTAQMPSHTHSVSSAHQHGGGGGANFWYTAAGGSSGFSNTSGSVAWNLEPSTGSSTTGLTSPTTATGSGASVTPTYTTPNVKYAALVIAQKS